MTIDNPVSIKEFYKDIDPMVIELRILFDNMNADIMALISKGIKEDWTPERLVQEFEKVIE